MLDIIVDQGRIAKDPAQSDKAVDLLARFLEEAPAFQKYPTATAATLIAGRIAEIDKLISAQVNEILHASEFQRLEASWLGLRRLVRESSIGADVRVKVMPVTKKELIKDFERATGFDQSALFKRIYEEEFGTLGGVPFGVLVSDFEFGRAPQDVRLLQELSHVAASAHAPLLTSVAPSLLDLDSFLDLDAPRDLAKIFESGELAAWRSFRDSDDSRYVAMTLPRVLMRLPYGPDTAPVEEFSFVEDCDGSDHRKYLWGASAWALAERVVSSYVTYGWCAAIRGSEGGGVVGNLPVHTFRSVSGDVVVKCPTETAVSDRREKELSDLGFMSLCHAKGTDYGVFFGGQTVNRPATYMTHAANANSRLAAMLPYVLAASRFAHYLKAMMRDKVGSFQSRTSIEKYLNNWITRYVTVDDEASQEVKARFPLRDASVEVREVPGRPGAYSAVVFLRPHFQLEELTASIRLVAELGAQK
ncbi:MAG TPA: type VI secretion system contractile sheath large subunit [Opitutaceae bacterium]|nr:type VI secretion system contractile sheath large subunit [Opitutaceae bacterium]